MAVEGDQCSNLKLSQKYYEHPDGFSPDEFWQFWHTLEDKNLVFSLKSFCFVFTSIHIYFEVQDQGHENNSRMFAESK